MSKQYLCVYPYRFFVVVVTVLPAHIMILADGGDGDKVLTLEKMHCEVELKTYLTPYTTYNLNISIILPLQ